jgi:hypothetical protein
MSALTVALGVAVVSVVERPQRKIEPVETHSELAASSFPKAPASDDMPAHLRDGDRSVGASSQLGYSISPPRLRGQPTLSDDDTVFVMLTEVPIQLAVNDFDAAWTQFGSVGSVAAPAAPSSSAPIASTGGSGSSSSDGSTVGTNDNAARTVPRTNLRAASHSAGSQFSGDVLVIGGEHGRKAVSGAEFFDPAQNDVVKTGKLNVARAAMTATGLDSGDILVTGGYGVSGAPLASVELFDSSTGVFALGSQSMSIARAHQTATVITGCNCPAEGEVLITGGFTQSSDRVPVNSAELYDPAPGTFTATGAMTIERANHTATAITGGPLAGKVLIVGGQDVNGLALLQAEVYDPVAGRFTAVSPLSFARKNQAAVYLDPSIVKGNDAGDILIAGGQDAYGDIASLEVFDPATSAFTSAGAMNVPRGLETATLLNSGAVLIAGGENTGVPLDSAELFDPNLQSSESTAAMASVHDGGTATLLQDGRVLIVSGRSSAAEYFDPDSALFSAAGNLTDKISEAGAALIK